MCIILDVNCFQEFKDKNNQDMKPVRNWLRRKNSKIAYAATKKFCSEWSGKEKRRQLKEWSRAGKLSQKDKIKVKKEINQLRGKIRSNDVHIIALARVANVKVLVSHDKDLHKDFTGLVGGKIYQTKQHSHLLVTDMCP